MTATFPAFVGLQGVYGASRSSSRKIRRALRVTDLSTGTDPHRHTPGTHNHTQTPAEQGRRGQARLPEPTDPPSEQASKRAEHRNDRPPAQSSSQPAPHRPRGPRAGRIPTPCVRSARPQGALNPGLPRDPARGGAHRGRERHPHTQHTHPHTLTHTPSLTHPVEERWKGAPGAHSGLLPSANTPAPPRPSHSPSPTASARRPREPTRRKRVIRTRALARAKAAPQRRYRAVVRKER